MTFFPTMCEYLSSLGLTAIAVSPNAVSGLVVDTIIYSSESSKKYLKE